MSPTILVVDDNAVNIMLIESTLQGEYKVLGASNGSEMWDILKISQPNLILMDVMMPEVDGFKLTRTLVHHPDYSDIPVIFLTAKDGSSDLKRGFDCGAMDYIAKPFNNTELKARIKSVLRIKTLENQLKRLSVTDPLTNLFNRRHFFEEAISEIERVKRGDATAKTFSLAILDIDHFKKINDTYGHQAGDYILTQLAKLLRHGIRRYDIPARYGGEEFIILFIGADKDIAFNILNRLKDSYCAQTFTFQSHTITSTFSSGLVHFNECSDGKDTIDDLIKIADARLYMAKKAGRNCIVNHF